MRVVFFGTPEFAVPTLEALAAEVDLAPIRVISQPSRPVGRKRTLQAPPVVDAAERLGLDFEQVESVRDKDFLARLEALEPDVAVVVAFGQIFRKRLLQLPRLGCVNLHASLLPRHRGAAPIQAAIAHQDPTTGVTTMRMSRGLDSGPMLEVAETAIGADETTPELSARLAAIGAALMVTTLRGLGDGSLEATPQDEAGVTYAPRLERADGEVDWTLDATAIYARQRAYTPWPGLLTHIAGRPLKIFEVAVGEGRTDAAPGTLLGSIDDGDDPAMAVACGGGTILRVPRVQRPGKQPLAAPIFLNGERLGPGERFEKP
ncbi:MAG: methionyl-tRNA formyltransferase [Acidobacteriota bacterium]